MSKYDPHGGLTVLNLSDGHQADWRPRNDRPAFQIAVSPDKTFVCAAVGGHGEAVTCLRPGEEWPMWDTGIKPEWDGISEHAKLTAVPPTKRPGAVSRSQPDDADRGNHAGLRASVSVFSERSGLSPASPLVPNGVICTFRPLLASGAASSRCSYSS